MYSLRKILELNPAIRSVNIDMIIR